MKGYKCPKCGSENIEFTYDDGGTLNLWNMRYHDDDTFSADLEIGIWCYDCEDDSTIVRECILLPQ